MTGANSLARIFSPENVVLVNAWSMCPSHTQPRLKFVAIASLVEENVTFLEADVLTCFGRHSNCRNRRKVD